MGKKKSTQEFKKNESVYLRGTGKLTVESYNEDTQVYTCKDVYGNIVTSSLLVLLGCK